MGFSRQEYWSGLPFASPEDLPKQGSNPRLLHLLHWQEDSLLLVPPGKPLAEYMDCIFNKHFKAASRHRPSTAHAPLQINVWIFLSEQDGSRHSSKSN